MSYMTKVQDIFREVLDDENITLTKETTAKDIEAWDSLAHITILEACEADFRVKFDIHDIIALHNVGDILDLIDKKINS